MASGITGAPLRRAIMPDAGQEVVHARRPLPVPLGEHQQHLPALEHLERGRERLAVARAAVDRERAEAADEPRGSGR